MATKGKAQLLITFVASPDQVDKIDSLVASHGAYMAKTHPRDGSKALLSYNFSKGPELAMTPSPVAADVDTVMFNPWGRTDLGCRRSAMGGPGCAVPHDVAGGVVGAVERLLVEPGDDAVQILHLGAGALDLVQPTWRR